MDSFRQSLVAEPARLLFIASEEDYAERLVLEQAGAKFLVVDWEAGHADYARKIQAGFEATDGEWIFTAADDISFHRGWADAAILIAQRTGKRVIGTADLGNPEVKRGATATHLLIARSYVLEHGTLDEAGQVFSFAYDHNWCDAECSLTAKIRDEWAFAKNSVVEHEHFHWNKGLGEDDTYRKGLKNFNQDRRRFQQRMGKYKRLRGAI
jgi:hypothetical protein